MGVRAACDDDVDAMVALSETFRARLAGYSPLFWRQAPDARGKQSLFFRALLARRDAFAFVHEPSASAPPDGFVIARLMPAPPVYAPGGPICLVDDFCVEPPKEWSTTGSALLDAAIAEGARRGAALTSIGTAHLDDAKRALLAARGFAVTSEWHVRANASDAKPLSDSPRGRLLGRDERRARPARRRGKRR
jgi:hypothetical protein